MQKTAEMKPTILAPHGLKGLTALELLQLPKGTRAKILTIKQHDHVLVVTAAWNSCEQAYPAWTRKFGAHVQPGKRFDSAIRYTDPKTKQVWILEVPSGPLRNVKDSILIANIDDCEAEVRKNEITAYVAEERLSVVENFPKENGWYQTDPASGIPVTIPLIDPDKNARYLFRADERVGPIARGYGPVIRGYGGIRDDEFVKRFIGVSIDYSPSDRLGVLTLDSVSEQIKKATGQ